MARAAPRRDARARATGRLGVSKGERYALLSDELLRSPAVCGLSAWSFRVLVAFCAQYSGANNGRLTLPGSVARDYGIRSKDLLATGTRECVAHRLLELTHQGGLPPHGCSRYALTWKPIDAFEAAGIERRPASNAWADWKPDGARRRRPPNGTTPSPTTGPACPDHRTSSPGKSPALVRPPDQQTQSLVRPPDSSEILGLGSTSQRGERGASRPSRASPAAGVSESDAWQRAKARAAASGFREPEPGESIGHYSGAVIVAEVELKAATRRSP